MTQVKLGTGKTFEAAEFAHEHIVVACADLEGFRAIEDMMNEEGALDTAHVTAHMDSGHSRSALRESPSRPGRH